MRDWNEQNKFDACDRASCGRARINIVHIAGSQQPDYHLFVERVRHGASADGLSLDVVGHPVARGARPAYYVEDVREALDEVSAELHAALFRFPPLNSPHEGHAVIREEMDELWDHVRANTGRSKEARHEAVQVAAMAVRYVIELAVKDQSRQVLQPTFAPSDSWDLTNEVKRCDGQCACGPAR